MRVNTALRARRAAHNKITNNIQTKKLMEVFWGGKQDVYKLTVKIELKVILCCSQRITNQY